MMTKHRTTARSSSYSALFLLAASLVSGCAMQGAQGVGLMTTAGRPAPEAPRPVARFPTETELDAIVAQAPSLESTHREGRPPVAVDAWIPVEVPAQGDPEYLDPGPVDALLARIARSDGIALRRSASLRCAAREMARFQLLHDGPPTARLTRHLLSACGSVAPAVNTLSLPYPGRGTAQELARQLAERMEANLRRGLSHGSWVGVGTAREGASAFLVIAFAQPPLSVEPWEGPEADGSVHIRGALRGAPGRVSAVITAGPHGHAECRPDGHTTLPAFAFSCPTAASDPDAQVEIRLTDDDDIAQRILTTLTVQRDARTARGYFAGEVDDGGAVSAAEVLDLVNQRRIAAGLSPLTLAEAESTRHQAYAPALFSLSNVGAGEPMGRLLLGLMAGWRVEGAPIRDAGSVWTMEQGGGSVGRAIGALLEAPSGRTTLLHPAARQLAVGLVDDRAAGTLGITLTTYQFFEGVDHRGDAERVVAALSELRQLRGLPGVERMGALPQLEARALTVAREGVWPQTALQAGLDEESHRLRASLQASHIEAVTLEHLPYPSEALNAARLQAEAVVTHTRASGSPWGQYVVYLVMR